MPSHIRIGRRLSPVLQMAPTRPATLPVAPIFTIRLRRRHQSTTAADSDPDPPAPPARWLADLRARIGRCIMFGCNASQVEAAARVLRVLGRDWRRLTAGAEGFLTEESAGGVPGVTRGLVGQKVVWGEMDSFGHVNNVAYVRYAESSRVNWITHFAVHEDPVNGKAWRELMTPKATGLILKSIEVDYKFPMTYPDTISVYHKLTHAPTTTSSSSNSSPSSFQLSCIVLSHAHQRVAATTEEDLVVYDYKSGRRSALPDFVATSFARIWELQDAESRAARNEIAALEESVRAIERATWDREDAVEDMGVLKR